MPKLGVLNYCHMPNFVTMQQFLQAKIDVPGVGILNFTSDAQTHHGYAAVSPG
jgi:hypothetical protein